MRDRLIELIKRDNCRNPFNCSPKCTYVESDDCHSERLADLILADGWIRPPCKVGDKVYYFSHRPLNLSVKANTVYEAKVIRIVTTFLGTSLVIQIRNEWGCTEIPDVREWGISVFATKEEAEAKLKGGMEE